MTESFSCSPLNDPVTESNTTLLENSHNPEILAKYRALCRQSGVEDGPQELRRLQRFVSQAIIKLLTKYNITQKDGRPYVSSSPKGFLQGPDAWLFDKGYYLSGWPRGLPKGSISIWPAHLTFALAAMFIDGTISLKPLAQRSQASPVHLSSISSQPKIHTAEKATKRPDAVLVAEDARKPNGDSDHDPDPDADGSSESEDSVSSPSEVPSRATLNREDVGPIASSTHSDSETSRPSSRTTAAKNLPPPSAAPGTESCPTVASTGPSESDEQEKFDTDLADPPKAEQLVSVDLGAVKKRKLETPYPGVPPGATINWIPPTSAARELKRTRRA